MALDRRSLLKRIAAAVVAALIGLVGLVNAPAAQAASAVSELDSIWNTYGSSTFTWAKAQPKADVIVNQQYTSTGVVYEVWDKQRVYKEGTPIWLDQGTIVPNVYGFASDNWAYPATHVNSVKLIQLLLNRQVERGKLGGSTIAVDGILGQNTAYKIGDFKTKWGLPTNGVVDANTWAMLVSAPY